ncbi:doublesex- and mab-3-related transcription factor B1 [Hippoglossus stenolepis]|uniref:doublesex- and mab-3-related transcription factor B1 n=1 Tax=Hippoglossus stenolepis TaxID=195615 RepID=UPI0017D17637|nr:doublesex- and mab-3-related transcription factor B1 [Hippoglossus stenolepis]
MSLSKPERRERKCPRCRFHGIMVPQRNHTRTCPFLQCDCWRCLQVTASTRVRAPQPSRPQDQEQRPGGPGSAAPPAEAPPSATSPGPGALDLRCRAAGGEGRVARLERSEEPPLTSTAAFNAPFFNEMLEIPPQFLPLPVLMPVYYPDTFAPYPTFFCTPLWVTPVPAAFFNSGLLGPCPHLPAAVEAGLLAVSACSS